VTKSGGLWSDITIQHCASRWLSNGKQRT